MTSNRTRQSAPDRILGIDPGLASTGVGVIERRNDTWRVVEAHEVRTSPGMAMPKRLKRIHDLVGETIREFRPGVVSVETIFFAENVKSAVLMAHGRGAAILAASDANLPVFEYSPLEIKQSVVGKGRASKDQVMQMVRMLLGLAEKPMSDHQADALACALAHAYRTRLKDAIEESKGGSSGEAAPAKALLAQARRGRRRR